MRCFRLFACLTFALLLTAPAWAQNAISRVLEEKQVPDDARLKPQRATRDKFHPWTPPGSKADWEKTAGLIREQVLVSNGLWPMPPAAPANPVVHGKIDREGYTIEKVILQSYPGFYVTGNLYRPKDGPAKKPAVLVPHGHWSNGRFYEATDKEIDSEISQGAEKFKAGAKYPLQACMVGLARMGCVVFHYDMVGNADSKQLGHASGFADADGELWLQNAMGLQTYNSLRALDFLLSLSDVDTNKVGVTGSSGGGTQTFLLTAIDSRPHAAFPAVMVSNNMQGGCVCENCDYLRIGINNVALAALFAPKPLAMSGANDWTIDIETKGLPELKQIYGYYDKAANVHAKAYPQFGHNYNQVAREMMYNWFNKHLQLGQPEPVVEKDFVPVSPAELSVFDAEHKLPADAVDGAKLRAEMKKVSQEQFAALVPKNEEGLKEYRRVVGTAAHVMLDQGVPDPDSIDAKQKGTQPLNGVMMKFLVGRKQEGTQIPTLLIIPPGFAGNVVLWIDGQGKSALFGKDGKVIPAVQKILDSKKAVVSGDVFLTGEFLADGKAAQFNVDPKFAGYTLCYNRPLISERVRDILTMIGSLKKVNFVKTIDLVGTNGAGPWALLAYSVGGDQIRRTVVDLENFHFGQIKSTTDPNLLPGALKYGGLGGLAAVAKPGYLEIHGAKDVPAESFAPLKAAFATTKETLKIEPAELKPEQVADSLAP